ncbi:Hypothetical protein NTJ_14418 [Nesidiocoris tenuis]|uniref:Uncharacterized protein n=1 Tax=Nesidiocoris tenuis TaxID=355587 RepID=A0ABN7BB89_9HEMI|nr:Hypothetical protein NTJ_14418 [Nesidiocoris tenuis]
MREGVLIFPKRSSGNGVQYTLRTSLSYRGRYPLSSNRCYRHLPPAFNILASRFILSLGELFRMGCLSFALSHMIQHFTIRLSANFEKFHCRGLKGATIDVEVEEILCQFWGKWK